MQNSKSATQSRWPPAKSAGEFLIGNDLRVTRLGFGAMRITGNGIWGAPTDRDEAVQVLRRAVELGIDFIDTADSYGPQVSEEIIAEALYPYPAQLVIATKGGFERPGPNRWVENGRPEHLRSACEGSLRRLRLDRIDLYQLHRIDPRVPAEDQLGTLKDLQAQGKIRHIGLSEITVRQIRHAQTIVSIVSVQNRYNLADRGSEDVLEYCEKRNIGFIPWFPLGAGKVSAVDSPLSRSSMVEGYSIPSGSGMAARTISRDAANPGNFERRTSRRKRRGCRLEDRQKQNARTGSHRVDTLGRYEAP